MSIRASKLSRNSIFGTIWIAGTRGVRRLKMEEARKTDLVHVANELKQHLVSSGSQRKEKYTLVMGSKLISGIIRIYGMRVNLLYDEAALLIASVRKVDISSLNSRKRKLPEKTGSAVKMPKGGEFDIMDFNIDLESMLHNAVSNADTITIRDIDDYMDVSFSQQLDDEIFDLGGPFDEELFNRFLQEQAAGERIQHNAFQMDVETREVIEAEIPEEAEMPQLPLIIDHPVPELPVEINQEMPEIPVEMNREVPDMPKDMNPELPEVMLPPSRESTIRLKLKAPRRLPKKPTSSIYVKRDNKLKVVDKTNLDDDFLNLDYNSDVEELIRNELQILDKLRYAPTESHYSEPPGSPLIDRRSSVDNEEFVPKNVLSPSVIECSQMPTPLQSLQKENLIAQSTPLLSLEKENLFTQSTLLLSLQEENIVAHSTPIRSLQEENLIEDTTLFQALSFSHLTTQEQNDTNFTKRWKNILKTVWANRIQTDGVTLEDVAQKPLNRNSISRAFQDLLAMAKLQYVTLHSLSNSLELSSIEAGPQLKEK